jgi:hypothetical protein
MRPSERQRLARSADAPHCGPVARAEPHLWRLTKSSASAAQAGGARSLISACVDAKMAASL